MTDPNALGLVGRAKSAVHRDFIVCQAGPMGRAAAGFAGMKRQHFVAPCIGKCASLGRVQANRNPVRIGPMRRKPPTNRTIAL